MSLSVLTGLEKWNNVNTNGFFSLHCAVSLTHGVLKKARGNLEVNLPRHVTHLLVMLLSTVVNSSSVNCSLSLKKKTNYCSLGLKGLSGGPGGGQCDWVAGCQWVDA